MELQIYHSVNEGLYLWNGKSGLLIDGLHRGKETGFSDTPERYIRMMRQGKSFFAKPNDLLFTHMHEDHFDQELVDEFINRYPERIVYAPGLDRSKIQPVVLEQGIARMQIEEYEIYAFTTVHDGKQYEQKPHCSYLIQWKNRWVWISGDAVLVPELADRIRTYTGQDGIWKAFVMVYQISSRSGKEFLKSLAPEQICLYHLPYPEDDKYHFRNLAEQKCRQCEAEGLPVEMVASDSFIDSEYRG